MWKIVWCCWGWKCSFIFSPRGKPLFLSLIFFMNNWRLGKLKRIFVSGWNEVVTILGNQTLQNSKYFLFLNCLKRTWVLGGRKQNWKKKPQSQWGACFILSKATGKVLIRVSIVYLQCSSYYPKECFLPMPREVCADPLNRYTVLWKLTNPSLSLK